MSEPQKTRVTREISPEWDEIMRLAEQIPNGEITIRIHQRKVAITDYHIRRKPQDEGDDFRTIPIA